MFWRKGRKIDEWLSKTANLTTIHSSQLQVYKELLEKIKEIEGKIIMWEKRMSFIANLLDDPMKTRGEPISCCEFWKSFNFEKVIFCPNCGNFLGFNGI